MNQVFILNDDIIYNKVEKVWQCSGLLGGHLLKVTIQSILKPNQLTQSIKFDWETEIEKWLEKNEIDENNTITIEIN